MKELIPMNEFGMMADKDSVARIDSRMIAEVFGKQHCHVMRDIRNLLNSGMSEEFRQSNFGQSNYLNEQGHSLVIGPVSGTGHRRRRARCGDSGKMKRVRIQSVPMVERRRLLMA